MMSSGFDIERLLSKARQTWLYWVPVVVLAVVGLNAAGYLLPEKYEARATVRIFQPQLQTVTGPARDVLAIQDRLKTIRNEMTSFVFLSEVARKRNMGGNLHPESAEYAEMIKKMADSLTLVVKNQDLFEVSYIGPKAQQVYDVTDEIVKLYIRNSSAYYENKTRDNVKFIREQLDAGNARLATAQDKIRQYKEAHINEIPDAQTEHLSRLGKLRTERQSYEQQLSAERDGLRLLLSKRDASSKEIVAQKQTQTSTELSDLTKRKRALELQLQTLLQDFTEEHWQVRETQAQLKLLDDQIAMEQTSQIEQITTSPNPQYQSLVEQIDLAEYQIKKLQAQIEKCSHDITVLEGYIDKIPVRQLELERLEDEHGVARAQVDMLNKRLQEAMLTSEIERGGQGPTFDLMDPPRLPLAPVSPNRKKIAAVSAVFGLGAGVALIFLLTVMDTALRSVEEAKRALRMPILGVVQRVVSAREEARLRRRRRRAIIGMSASLTLVVVAVIVGLTMYREPLQTQLDHLLKLVGRP